MGKSLTSGAPAKLIFFFALPLFIGNLFQQIYGIANTIIVGRTIGMHALASVGSTGSIMFFVVGFIQAMTAGFAIVTAQNYGGRKMAGVRHSFCVSITLGCLTSIALTALAVSSANGVLTLLQTPPEIHAGAYSYIIVIYAGLPITVLFNLLANTILALGDSRPPLVFLSISCALNIFLDLLFILVFGWGVAGAAWATLIAQAASSLCCVVYIIRRVPALHLRKKDWKFTTPDLLRSARIGLPMGFQASIIAIGAIVLQWALNALGPVSVAAFTAARSIDLVAILPMASFGLAMATYVGQNYGARDLARIRQGVRHCAAMSLAFSVAIGLVNIFCGHILIAVFVGPEEKDVMRLAQIFLNINGSAYWVLSLLFIFRYTLQGLGQSLMPTMAGIMELIMRALAAVFLARAFGFPGACMASPLAWVGACLPLSLAYVWSLRKLNREGIP